MRPATSLMGVSSGSEPSRFANGFVADRVDLGVHQLAGELGQRREMQIGEQDQARAEMRVLGRLRLLDLDHQIGLAPDFRGGGQDLGRLRRCIPDPGWSCRRRLRLHQHPMAGFAQRRYAARDQPDACFVILDFLRYADDH